MRGDNVPVIFGIKLKRFREERGYNLKTFSQLAGVSPSYLNEIEKGKKYPKTEKIVQMADALGVAYDDLVSVKLDQGLNPLEAVLESPIIRELPFHLFGVSQQDILNLIIKAPKKTVALIHTLDEITRGYDMRVEHFFYAMLRSYQETHENYFEDIEQAVEAFRAEQGWDGGRPLAREQAEQVLASRFDVEVDRGAMDSYPELQGFRSIWVEGPPHRLLINDRLTPEQQTFQMGREIGYRVLELEERGTTSSRAEVRSFEQVLNDFKASYFAGALMIGEQALVAGLREFFSRPDWDGEAFQQLQVRFGVTPEMFLYRLTQIIPAHFGLNEFYFLRFSNPGEGGAYHLTKHFNRSSVFFPTSIEQHEHYCRRWLAVDVLRELRERQAREAVDTPIIGAQVSHFLEGESDYFVVTMARALALTPGTNTSVTVGFRITEDFKNQVAFWGDPAVPRKLINETCERCPLSAEECQERAAPPSLAQQRMEITARKVALERLLSAYGPGSA